MLIEDLVVMDVFSLECSAKRSKSVAVDLASGTNDLLGDGTHRLSIQFGNLHFEEEGAFLTGERHRCQRAGLIGSSAPFPIG